MTGHRDRDGVNRSGKSADDTAQAMVKGYQLDRDLYLELRAECYDTVLDTTIEGIDEIHEHKIEPRCDEAVGMHTQIGEINKPRVNAAILVVCQRTTDALEDMKPSLFSENAAEFLAELAHTAVKYDLIARVLDEQAEAER
jgi:hypothetical protein